MVDFNIENIYLNRAKFVMKLLGVWMPLENEFLLQKLYRIFMMSLQYLFFLFQVIYMVQVWGDLEAVSEASYVLFTQACLCFKITVFQINVKMLRELLKMTRLDVFKPKCIQHKAVLKFQASRIKRLLLGFMLSSQTTCLLWALKPLFDDGQRAFPFLMWMPVKPDYSPQYELGYAFQLLTVCMSAYMYFGVDSVSLSMVTFACAQIDIIKYKIMSVQSINNRSKIEEKQVLLENYKNLADCVKHHQAIDTFVQLVENTYHTYLLFQLSGTVGVICMSALRILVVSPRSMQFLSIVVYVLVMISQIFVCCWCGHELTATSESLHATLYQCYWYEQDVKFKRALYFVMLRTSRPMVLRAGHYVSLSRQTFVTILRTSYSYFAVLYQTYKG